MLIKALLLSEFIALVVLLPVNEAGIPLPVLASRARSKNLAGDAFRKGYRTRLEDAVEQSDLVQDARSYHRGASGYIAERDANIATGPDGYLATGGQQIGKSGEFDRGSMYVNRSRVIRQDADVASVGVDLGHAEEERRGIAQIATYPGDISAGANSAVQHVKRYQDLADGERSDQFLHAELLNEEKYDRGVANKAAASQTNILAGGLASGASSADFSATRDRSRFVNTMPDAGITEDRRHVAKEDRAVNAAASSTAAENGAVFAPLGTAGRERALEDVRTHQAAVHKGVVQESHAFDAPVERHLQSDWVKGNVASEAAIDALAGLASGQSAKQIASGFDQRDTQITIANRAARETVSDSAEFDDRHGIRAADKKAVII